MTNDSRSKFVADAASVRQQIPAMVYADASSVGHHDANLERLNDESLRRLETTGIEPVTMLEIDLLVEYAANFDGRFAPSIP